MSEQQTAGTIPIEKKVPKQEAGFRLPYRFEIDPVQAAESVVGDDCIYRLGACSLRHFYSFEWHESAYGLCQNAERSLWFLFWHYGDPCEGDSAASLRSWRFNCVPDFGMEYRCRGAVLGRSDGGYRGYGLFSTAANVYFDSIYGGSEYRSRWGLGIVDGDSEDTIFKLMN